MPMCEVMNIYGIYYVYIIVSRKAGPRVLVMTSVRPSIPPSVRPDGLRY